MTRIDFYILKDQSVDAMHRFACRLAAKAITAGTPVHIRAPDTAVADELDTLLWHYPPHRFIAHGIEGQSDSEKAPVIIGTGEPAAHDGLLINLSQDVPTYFGRFDRVAEIVVGATRNEGRDRYKHYRDRGCPLHHHELDDWEGA